MSGKLIGVGLGPGDPELVTLKALKAIATAEVIAFFAKAGNPGQARGIVAPYLTASHRELPLLYPVTVEVHKDTAEYKDAIRRFYDEAAEQVARELEAGRTVAAVCEGDPLFYGSYMHLHVRLAGRYPTEVIPGISGMAGCWSQAGLPIVQGDDVLSVLPATLPEETLARRLGESEAAVVMKLGRNLPKVRRALASAGRLERAVYVERGTMQGGRCERLADKADDAAPYFSLILVPGWEARG